MLPIYTNQKKSHKNSGFTLFEIMVIVVIIGLLMIIAIPNYLSSRDRAINDVCVSNQKAIFSAAVMYTINETTSLENLGATERLQALIDAGYLKGSNWRECPASGDDDYDDYTIVFENSEVVDVECAEKPASHKWP